MNLSISSVQASINIEFTSFMPLGRSLIKVFSGWSLATAIASLSPASSLSLVTIMLSNSSIKPLLSSLYVSAPTIPIAVKPAICIVSASVSPSKISRTFLELLSTRSSP